MEINCVIDFFAGEKASETESQRKGERLCLGKGFQ